MAAKKKPAARRAREAARRAAVAERARPKYLYDLKPPGTYYREWDTPQGTDDEAMNRVKRDFGPDSDVALGMRFILEYRKTYGPRVPVMAARQLDQIVVRTDLATDLAQTMGIPPEEAREHLHTLHARGILLISDDGSLWMTVPPGFGTNDHWTFVDKKADNPLEGATE
ncbi:hypothetical protein [Streptomyces candidus]|uniref:Uncharacterized protein n=1 Tax=Streptomyces candidus TaxID=67283 RepID=A0A7X0LTI7_9ACTN|nr:hypothetical protein [Streptomyces candidus]MBB6439066.1 hypothetical protein [Streptomyces candidus]GHH55506.1 hypothetical protein GCM10018773_60060 [Streptomyces candidus]